MKREGMRPWVPGALALALGLGASAGGCGYGLSASGRAAHKSIAVPMFTNETATLEYGLEEQTTQAVVAAFVADNRLKVVSPGEAETVLRGRVMDYRQGPYTYDKQEQVQEYRVDIVLDLEYVEVASGKPIWHEQAFAVWASYSPGRLKEDGSAETVEDGKRAAVEKVAREIVARTIEGW